MNTLTQSLKRHPASLIVFLMYSFLWCAWFSAYLNLRNYDLERGNRADRLAIGEGTMYGWLFAIAFGFVLLIAIIARAASRKSRDIYYYILGGLVALSLLFLFSTI